MLFFKIFCALEKYAVTKAIKRWTTLLKQIIMLSSILQLGFQQHFVGIPKHNHAELQLFSL